MVSLHGVRIERSIRADQGIACERLAGDGPPVGKHADAVDSLGSQKLEIGYIVGRVESIEVRYEGQEARLAIDREVIAL
ncbi:MAG TPA: hypothetical protein VK607_15205, partial [Kofleriaceae bacterium]|nr:hypothetical protein [Kofleriaceae bacterium]